MINPRPLALGLLHLADGTTGPERARVRVAVALRANREGYALVDIVELPTSVAPDDPRLETIAQLASHLDIQALIVDGVGDAEPLLDLADRLRLVVHGPRSR